MDNKQCSKCHNTYPATLEYFYRSPYKRKDGTYGLQPKCKECEKSLVKQWAKENSDKRKATKKRERIRNAQYYKEYNARYAKLHSEKAVDRARAWARDNKERRRDIIRNYCARRRAIELSLTEHFTSKDVELRLKNQRGKCWWCGCKIAGRQFHVDHVIPLARGGGDGPDNICISCPSCNYRKNSKLPHEFAGRLL